jgi:hypothetical protein
MTTIATCSTIAEAELLKSVLDSAGIAAFLPEATTAYTAPQLVFASGLRLQVEDEDAATARKVLDSARSAPDQPAR